MPTWSAVAWNIYELTKNISLKTRRARCGFCFLNPQREYIFETIFELF
jgi:hypothetical protein